MSRDLRERHMRARWARRRRRLIAYGQWQPFVDPTPTREHVNDLRRFGLSLETVSLMAGEHESALSTLMQESNHAYLSKLRPEREAAYLAVTFDLDLVPGHHKVAAAGTKRRIEGLMCVGWPQRFIADRLGVSPQAVNQYRGRPLVTARIARLVRDLYDELAMTPGPSVVTVSWARKQRLVPPMGWDDDAIDDPDVKPLHRLRDAALRGVDEAAVERRLAGERVKVTRAERWVCVRRLHALGWNDSQIGDQLGFPDRTVLRDRQRLGLVANVQPSRVAS